MLLCEISLGRAPYRAAALIHRLVCPVCGNMLTISAANPDDLGPSEQHRAGSNRFECRTCPYQMFIQGRYFEKKLMKKKEVEDVLGGADSWKNVDKIPNSMIVLGQT